MSLRLSKIAMLLGLAFFAFVVMPNNIVDYGLSFVFVQHVLPVDTIFERNVLMGRAISTERMWHVAIADHRGRRADRAFARHPCDPARNDTAGASACLSRGQELSGSGRDHRFPGLIRRVHGVRGRVAPDAAIRDLERSAAAFRFYIIILAVLILVMQPDEEPR